MSGENFAKTEPGRVISVHWLHVFGLSVNMETVIEPQLWTGDLLSVTYNDQLSECEDRRADPDQGVDDCTKPDRECRPH